MNDEKITSRDTRWGEREKQRAAGQKDAKPVRPESNLEVIKKKPKKSSGSRASRELGRYEVPEAEKETDPVGEPTHSFAGPTDRDYQDGKTNQADRD